MSSPVSTLKSIQNLRRGISVHRTVFIVQVKRVKVEKDYGFLTCLVRNENDVLVTISVKLFVGMLQAAAKLAEGDLIELAKVSRSRAGRRFSSSYTRQVTDTAEELLCVERSMLSVYKRHADVVIKRVADLVLNMKAVTFVGIVDEAAEVENGRFIVVIIDQEEEVIEAVFKDDPKLLANDEIRLLGDVFSDNGSKNLRVSKFAIIKRKEPEEKLEETESDNE